MGNSEFIDTNKSDLMNKLREFVQERDWEQYHNPKDLAIALSIEANELLEKFLWKSPEGVMKEDISHEIADVFIYALMFADKYDLDIESAILDKLEHNKKKYPVEKAKGKMNKYTEYIN